MIDVKTLTDTELSGLLDACKLEARRRECVVEALAGDKDLAGASLSLSGREPAAQWVQPLGAFDAYPRGWIVTYEGKQWESLLDGNVWTPSISGWREVPSEGENGETPGVPEWMQPTGAHDAYQAGEFVMFEGEKWVSLVDGNVWPPGAYGWEKVADPEPDPEPEKPTEETD